jgi:glycosyltransferase involved in cell wall biosynthesis
VESLHVSDDELPDLYRGLDYLLVTSSYEGGPMSALEAIASGVPVISPEIGWMPELPHISYEVGDLDQLNKILENLSSPLHELRRSVSARTWDNFINQHRTLFSQFN